MKKNFKSNFDDLLTSTIPSQQTANDNSQQYTRVTIAIRSDLLEKIRILCLKERTKLRFVINDLIEKHLQTKNIN